MTAFPMEALPLLILSVGIIATLLLGVFARGVYACAFLTLAAALFSAAAGGWEGAAAYGLAFTPFSRFFTVLFALTALPALLLGHDYNRRHGISGEEFPATLVFAVFGMSVTVSAGNLLVLFLGLESLTFAFYILTAIDLHSERSAEAGLKYLLNGAVAAACIAFGIALVYGGTGSLSLSPGSPALHDLPPLALAGWGLFLAGAAFKVSLVPFHLWTPDVYEGAPAPVVAFLSTASKGASFAALIMVAASGTFVRDLHLPLWWLALLSMLVGNLAALRERNVRRMLGYSSVAQMGYVALALLSGAAGGYSAAAFYLAAYAAMNLAAFGALSALGAGAGVLRVADLRGCGYRHPLRGLVLALAMFALAGIPPTAGFTGKFAIFLAALKAGEVFLAVAGILSAAASVYFYLRVVAALYMQAPDAPVALPVPARRPGETLSLVAACAAILFLGIYPAPLLDTVALIVR